MLCCVLCVSDGVGRTGAFISTHAEMERMKAEAVVDLFQYIKAARVQRKGLVLTKVREEKSVCLRLTREREKWGCNIDLVWLFCRLNMSFAIKCWQTTWMGLKPTPTSKVPLKDIFTHFIL